MISRIWAGSQGLIGVSIGMLPIALAGGAGAEWKNGLAWALIGDLTSSMFLPLLLIPVVYAKADRWKERFPILLSHPRQLLGWGPREADR